MCYLPHRAAIREASSTTKLRVVFYASWHTTRELWLNHDLQKGPNLNNVLKILVNFRSERIVLSADIQKAFLHISVKPEGRDAYRFLWFDSSPVLGEKYAPIQEFRMTIVPLGSTASPFFFTTTLQHHWRSVEGEAKATARHFKSVYMLST